MDCETLSIEAESGAEALELVSETGGLHFDVLSTDLGMPGIRGTELSHILLEKRPGLKVLHISGCADDMISDRRLPAKAIPLSQKPFSSISLVSAVRKLLDE